MAKKKKKSPAKNTPVKKPVKVQRKAEKVKQVKRKPESPKKKASKPAPAKKVQKAPVKQKRRTEPAKKAQKPAPAKKAPVKQKRKPEPPKKKPSKPAPARKVQKAPSKPKRKPEPARRAPVKETRKKQKPLPPKPRKPITFDASRPVSKVNLERARKSTIKNEKKKIYQKKYRLKKKLEAAKTPKERKAIRNEAFRTARWMEQANRALGKKVKKAGFKKKIERVGRKIIVQNSFVWESSKVIEGLIDSGKFKIFEINGVRFKKSQVMDIMAEMDEVYDEASFDNSYFVAIEQDANTGVVSITLPEAPSTQQEENE